MQTRILPLLLFAFALPAGAAHAERANMVLRERVAHVRPVVRLRDLADVTSEGSAQLAELLNTPLLPAPAQGASIFLTKAQIRDLLASRGADLGSVTLTGAAVVEIGQTGQLPSQKTAASSAEPSLLETEVAIRQAIERYLEQQAGRTGWRIEIDLGQSATKQLAAAGGLLTVRGGRQPWTGRQRFYLTTSPEGDETIVPTRVALVQPAVFAKRRIERGDLVRRSDVEVRQHEGQLPRGALMTVEQVVGKEAIRAIQVDTMVQESFVRAPLLVKRGETVTVFARTGGIAVKTVAIARQDGAMGELVQIETADNQERFAAIVAGRRELEVLATGRSAREFASFGDRQRR